LGPAQVRYLLQDPGGKPRRLQPERVLAEKWKFFTWIRRNPLKSPDSAKEKQGNPS
jgi:hypothetical protein